MRKIIQYVFLALTLFPGYSCEKEEIPFISENDELFIGFWKEMGYDNDHYLFDRTVNLANDAYAFGILSDGTFLENKNSGWCATPPISYARYVGNWLELSPDSLLISTKFWGGDIQFVLVIQSVSKGRLEARIENIFMEDTED